MTGTMMMERPTTGMFSSYGNGWDRDADARTMAPNMVMVPRCTMKMEKCAGGMKITLRLYRCVCPRFMQNLRG